MDKTKKILLPILVVFFLGVSLAAYLVISERAKNSQENETLGEATQEVVMSSYPASTLLREGVDGNLVSRTYVSDASVEEITQYYTEEFSELKLSEISDDFVTLNKLDNPLLPEMLQVSIEEKDAWLDRNSNQEGVFITWVDIVKVEGNREYLKGSVEGVDDLVDEQVIIFQNYYR